MTIPQKPFCRALLLFNLFVLPLSILPTKPGIMAYNTHFSRISQHRHLRTFFILSQHYPGLTPAHSHILPFKLAGTHHLFMPHSIHTPSLSLFPNKLFPINSFRSMHEPFRISFTHSYQERCISLPHTPPIRLPLSHFCPPGLTVLLLPYSNTNMARRQKE